MPVRGLARSVPSGGVADGNIADSHGLNLAAMRRRDGRSARIDGQGTVAGNTDPERRAYADNCPHDSRAAAGTRAGRGGREYCRL
jgi:nitrite reductase/ring-hydroxylating ferredoxin subunit